MSEIREVKLFGLTFEEFQGASLRGYQAAIAAVILEEEKKILLKRGGCLSNEERDLLLEKYNTSMPKLMEVVTGEYLEIQKELFDTPKRFVLAVKADVMRKALASHIDKVLTEAYKEWVNETESTRRKKYLRNLEAE